MLDPVALHQTRFNVPGLLPDGRGVLLGKQGALSFPSVDALVGFFRIFGEEASLDELLPKLRIEEVRGQAGARQFLVLFAAASSYLTDRASRIAVLLGGLGYTGAGKHFVRYRDARSPLGYDARALSSEPGDFLLYDERFTLALTRVREVSFAQLVLRLSPRALPGHRDPALDRGRLWLLAREGLARSLLSYLWRNHVAAFAGTLEPTAGGAAFVGRPRWLLVRVEELPERILQLVTDLPGVEVYQQVGERALVQVGWRHPIRLESCASIFEPDHLYVFSGTRDAAEVFDQPALVPAQGLVERGFQLDERALPVGQAQAALKQISVPLRLAPSEVGAKVTAVLVPWARVAWLRKLVYAAPQRLLQSAKVMALTDGLLVVADDGLSAMPVGQPFWRAAPGVLLPVGYRIEPAVSEAVLSEHLGASASRLVLFPLPAGRAPVGIDATGMVPLGRTALDALEVPTEPASLALGIAGLADPVRVQHGKQGLFPLWGFRSDESE